MTPRTKVNTHSRRRLKPPCVLCIDGVCEFVRMGIVFSISVVGWWWSIGHLKHVFFLRLEPPSKHSTIWKVWLDPSHHGFGFLSNPPEFDESQLGGETDRPCWLVVVCQQGQQGIMISTLGTCELRDATSIQKSWSLVVPKWFLDRFNQSIETSWHRQKQSKWKFSERTKSQEPDDRSVAGWCWMWYFHR